VLDRSASSGEIAFSQDPEQSAGGHDYAARRAQETAMNESTAMPLRAMFLNCTLKPAGQPSHTELLIEIPASIMRRNGVSVDIVRPVDLELAPGVQHDMTEHGFERDDWPALCERVMQSDIVVLCTPIWLGEQSSVCRRVIERLYAESGKLNDKGQYVYYGRVGGALVTGNEDGVKHCASSLLYALQHLGFAIPPQADTGWIGEAGPGPSYGDDGAGCGNDYTQRTAAFMAWNLMHMARLLKQAGGMPSEGNQKTRWDDGCRFDHPNPEFR
jgi:multimeric flavodoxin WrbA